MAAKGALLSRGLAVLLVSWCMTHQAFAAGRLFTLEDEIGLADFGDISYTGKVQAITYSPNGKLVAVHAARGLPRENLVESEVRVYSVTDLRGFAARPASGVPAPIWSLKRSTYREAPIIQDLRWTADSAGLAFLLRTSSGSMQLSFASLGGSRVSRLSAEGQSVTAFDLVNEHCYAYSVRDLSRVSPDGGEAAPASDVTGKALNEVLFPIKDYPGRARTVDRSELWAACGGTRPARVRDAASGEPVVIFAEGQRSLRLSPDGRWLLTVRPVATVPVEWALEYLPPSQSQPYRIEAGPQDLAGSDGAFLTGRYEIIDLQSGAVVTPVDSPTGAGAFWPVRVSPQWSASSTAVILPSVFMPRAEDDAGARGVPCLAVFDLSTRATRCVESPSRETVKMGSGGGSRTERITAVEFAEDVGKSVRVTAAEVTGVDVVRRYRRASSGAWRLTRTSREAPVPPVVSIEQSASDPPVLAIAGKQPRAARTVWDPNPQLSGIDLGRVSVLQWKTTAGREMTGGLYLPPGDAGQRRYPLVIQTHEFDERAFRPSGIYPTSYAARVLVAHGIAVLQTRCSAAAWTAEELTCQVQSYEAAVRMLDESGLIDRERIGIIGFSRTCMYVLKALTTSGIAFRAASITDGTNEGYWQEMLAVDLQGSRFSAERVSRLGAPPWGEGLTQWLRNASTFNMQKVTAPLQVFGAGPASLMSMWEPYALLRLQGKPTEMVMLGTDEHVLTNPAVRRASQGRTVDWMRFWLKAEEDPVPEKRDQYRAWQKLAASTGRK
jgi:prolyl oligopeptidase family protein